MPYHHHRPRNAAKIIEAGGSASVIYLTKAVASLAPSRWRQAMTHNHAGGSWSAKCQPLLAAVKSGKLVSRVSQRLINWRGEIDNCGVINQKLCLGGAAYSRRRSCRPSLEASIARRDKCLKSAGKSSSYAEAISVKATSRR